MLTKIIKRTTYKTKNLQKYFFRKTQDIPADEFFDSPEEFKRHVDIISDILTTTQNSLIFCGAGLSTPSGIPDYRSGYKTVLKTGPGKWEIEKENNKPYEKQTQSKMAVEAWPNEAHLAIKSLEEAGLVKTVISQNVDGLLSRVQFPEKKKIELHGNIYKERCLECGKVFWRDFSTTKKNQRRITERKCDCKEGADIRVSLVYFGDSLQPDDISNSYEAVQEAGFCMAIGSSLMVTPAANFVREFIRNQKKVGIINLQRTQMHSQKTINVHAHTDIFLKSVVENLGLEMPKREIYRDIKLERFESPDDFQLQCFDFEGKRWDSLKKIEFLGDSGKMEVNDGYTHKIYRRDIDNGKFEILRIWLYLDLGDVPVDLNVKRLKDNGETARIFYRYCHEKGIEYDRVEYF